MTEPRFWGEATIFDCNDMEASLHFSNSYRYLQIKGSCNGNKAQLTMFFKSQQDQDAVIQQLYTELGKLQPKF